MDASLLAFLFAAAGAVALAIFVYRRRELRVRGGSMLAALRASVLVLALLLIWNPQLPGRIAPQAAADSWILLDRSVSMSADPTTWRDALERVDDLWTPGMRLATFGSRVESIEPDGLEGTEPDAPTSHLAAALERAAEAGARSVVVVSDLRIRDGAAAGAVLARSPVEVRFETVGGRLRNAGLAEVVTPGSVESGGDLTLGLVVQGEGGQAGDSVTVEVREGDRLVSSTRVELPGDGRQTRTQITVAAPEQEGWIRYTARVRWEPRNRAPSADRDRCRARI